MGELASPVIHVRFIDKPYITVKTYFVQGMVKVRKYGISAEGSELDSYP